VDGVGSALPSGVGRGGGSWSGSSGSPGRTSRERDGRAILRPMDVGGPLTTLASHRRPSWLFPSLGIGAEGAAWLCTSDHLPIYVLGAPPPPPAPLHVDVRLRLRNKTQVPITVLGVPLRGGSRSAPPPRPARLPGSIRGGDPRGRRSPSRGTFPAASPGGRRSSGGGRGQACRPGEDEPGSAEEAPLRAPEKDRQI
jgi:hypothetical protein